MIRWVSILLCAVLASVASAVTIGGQAYTGLRTTASKLGLKEVTIAGTKARLSNANQSVSLTLHQRSAKINGTGVWLNYPIAEINNLFYISRMDYQRTLIPLLRPTASMNDGLRLRHIVIDPGHGGRDTGARNTKLRTSEKTLTLDVALRVQQELEALGYKVTLTRTDDKFVALKDRPAIANRLRADLFISIHFNAAADSAIRGIETFCYTPQGAPSSARDKLLPSDKIANTSNKYDTASLWLGYDIQRSTVRAVKAPDRGVKRARFAVLEDLNCPGILFEGGFLSSPTEGSRLTSSLYRQQLAQGIVSGIRAYHRRIIN